MGEGAFASVDECLLRGQHVAVKRLKPELFANEADLKSFVTEGVTIARLSHPCARVFGLGLSLPSTVFTCHHRERSGLFCQYYGVPADQARYCIVVQTPLMRRDVRHHMCVPQSVAVTGLEVACGRGEMHGRQS